MILVKENNIFLYYKTRYVVIGSFSKSGKFDAIYLYNFKKQKFLPQIKQKQYNIKTELDIAYFATILLSGMAC